jgi:RNA polymerase sigma-70 factor, ECF subfamily
VAPAGGRPVQAGGVPVAATVTEVRLGRPRAAIRVAATGTEPSRKCDAGCAGGRRWRPGSPAGGVRYGLVVQPVETSVVEALRAGDESAFARLVKEHGASMLRVARLYVGSRAVAEEVVQEAWLAVLNGIGAFEGRSTLKTWIFRILANIAKTRGQREGRSIPFSALAPDDEPAVDPDRFLADGQWASPPASWGPEDQLLGQETRAAIDQAIAALPPSQAIVITMRDVEGFSSEETRNALDVSETNQRVLLHRARSKVRQALEEYLK